MEQIHNLFYKDGEEWKPLAYGDIITTTEPDAEKEPEQEALELLMQEPVTFTATMTMTKKEVKKLLQIIAPKNQRERLRAAKRRNRQRRLRRWKDNTKTVPPCLQALRL